MCGICGIRTDAPSPEGVLERMVAALAHRGPDSAGFFAAPGYRAGMRRLSINDLTGGDQPLYNADRSVALLYNGEIYNYHELRRELEARGVRLRTRSDGEVICHLYDIHGEELFERLDGMFACALWSEAEKKLILARDLPGEKPLYYAQLSDTELAFASEIKSLVRYPGVDRSLNLQALWDYPTFLWIPDPDTAFMGVKSLPRGHLLVADAAGIRIRPYANRFAPEVRGNGADEAELIAAVRRTVTGAVRSRLLSDVPVGSFLSGGLDSSIVASVAARELDRLDTFTIGFEDLADPYHGRADESAQAAAFAETLGTRHHTIRVTAQDFHKNLVEFCTCGDQPFAVSSGLGILSVAEAARDAGIKVLLTGDGADEAFGGYSWYFHLAALAGRTPRRLGNGGEVSFQNFGMPLEERLDYLAGYDPPRRAWAWHYYAGESEKALLFDRRRFSGVADSTRHFAAWNPGGDWTPGDYISQDRDFYFPFEMLTKADRMTMGRSVEGRVPFAAPAVQALAGTLRFRDMVRNGDLKWVLRRAFEDVLPRDIVARPKHGFNVPIDHWLQNEWSHLVDEAFAPSSALSRHELIAPDAGTQARRLLANPQRLSGHSVFSYICLNLWLEVSESWR